MASRGRCCLCGQMPGVVCFINGDDADFSRDNLIVLCPRHKNELDSRTLDMSAQQLRRAQRDWQRRCLREVMASAGCSPSSPAKA
jgi:hypothetical protein